MRLRLSLIVLATLTVTSSAQAPRTHRLEATPDTISYGYYWSEAKPVLRIASGDIVDVDTLITNRPTSLLQAGVPADKIQTSLRTIVAEVTGDRRGPGGHILTGPIFVEGAEPGDALEVKVLSIDLPIDYGYNGCSGFIPTNCDRSMPTKIFHLDRKSMTSEFKPGIVVPLAPFFGSMGVAPAPERGRVSSNPPAATRAISTIASSSPARRSTSLCSYRVRSSPLATVMRRRVMARSARQRSRRRCAGACSSRCARGCR